MGKQSLPAAREGHHISEGKKKPSLRQLVGSFNVARSVWHRLVILPPVIITASTPFKNRASCAPSAAVRDTDGQVDAVAGGPSSAPRLGARNRSPNAGQQGGYIERYTRTFFRQRPPEAGQEAQLRASAAGPTGALDDVDNFRPMARSGVGRNEGLCPSCGPARCLRRPIRARLVSTVSFRLSVMPCLGTKKGGRFSGFDATSCLYYLSPQAPRPAASTCKARQLNFFSYGRGKISQRRAQARILPLSLSPAPASPRIARHARLVLVVKDPGRYGRRCWHLLYFVKPGNRPPSRSALPGNCQEKSRDELQATLDSIRAGRPASVGRIPALKRNFAGDACAHLVGRDHSWKRAEHCHRPALL